MNPPRVDLTQPGWLGHLLDHYQETYEPAEALGRVEALRRAHPDLLLDSLADRLAQERLQELGLRVGSGLLLPTLRERSTRRFSKLPEPELEAAGLLSLTWDLLQDVAALAGDQAPRLERRVQLLTLMALAREDYGLAHRLHGRQGDLRELESLLERRVAPAGRLTGLRPTSTGIGLLYLHTRAQARIAVHYYETRSVEQHGVELLHHLSRRERLDLIRVLIALAWVDGVVTAEERALIKQQIEWAALEASASAQLELLLEQPLALDELEIQPLERGARQFVLEQAVLVTLVDDDQADAELAALETLAQRLGAERSELERALIRVTAFYLQNRDALRSLSQTRSYSRLHRLLIDRAQAAVRQNTAALVTEIKETGELAKLLTLASTRSLTREEQVKVKAQLVDLAKTVPALAIFAIPGGSFLLPVLIKALPFNVLPSAFAGGGPDPLPPPPSE